MSRSYPLGSSGAYEVNRSHVDRHSQPVFPQRPPLEGSQASRQVRPTVTSAGGGLSPIVHQSMPQTSKTQEVVNRLQEIIRLCKDENGLSQQQMHQVLKVESEVLGYLQRTAQVQPQPIPPNTTSERGSPPPQRSKASIQQAANIQTWGKEQYSQVHATLSSSDVHEMIAEIERKAVNQILHLQQERDQLKQDKEYLLVQLEKASQQQPQQHHHQPYAGSAPAPPESAEYHQLLQQNRLLKEQNSALQVRLQTVGNTSVPGRDSASIYPRDGLSQQQYDSQIAVYENELRRASAVINELKSRLNNVPGLESLHQQGEQIRQETGQLLVMKGGSTENVSMIRELQQRLQEEELGKAAFLEQLKIFKQRFAELEEENRRLRKGKVSFDSMPREGYSEPLPQDYPSASRGIIKKRGGLGDYEKTLSQMQSALRA